MSSSDILDIGNLCPTDLCFPMDCLSGTGIPEVIESEWFTPIALAIITATGVLFLVATTLPPMMVLGSALAMSALILFLRNTGGIDDILNRDPSASQHYQMPTEERNRLITRLLRNNPLPQGVNEAHLRHSHRFEGDAISIPDGCDPAAIQLNELTNLFDAMNTHTEFMPDGTRSPDYVDRNSNCVISDSTTPISYTQARANIETVVGQITNRESFIGVPSHNPAKEEFFVKIETYLKVIIHEIRSGRHDASICNDIILQCTTSVGHCGGRYMSVFSEGYERLITRVAFSSYDDIALEELHRLRKTIVMQMTQNHPRGGGAYQPHVLNAHMMNVGLARGVRGAEHLSFDDVFEVHINQAQSIREFDALYSPAVLQARFEEMVNGARIMNSSGHPSNPPRFNVNDASIGKDRTYGWLENHAPPEWAPSVRDATTGNVVTLNDTQIEALFGAPFDQEQQQAVVHNPTHQRLEGAARLQAIRNGMFKMASTSNVLGNVKAVACTYVLNQLGVLNRQIDWTELHMDTNVLDTLFAYDNDDLNDANITF